MTQAENETPKTHRTGEVEATLKRRRLRKRLMVGFLLILILAAGGWAAWWHFIGSHYVETDNAYVGVTLSQVTPQVGGTVTEVTVHDTDTVKAGDVLVKLDPADAKLMLASAEAKLAATERRVRQTVALVAAGEAQVKLRKADLARAKVDLDRRKALASSGAVSGEELTVAQTAYTTAEAALEAAKQQLDAQRVLVDGVDVDHNPDVLAAKAAVDTAKLELERTVLHAPVGGVVAKLQAQAGQHVGVGAPLMQIVPLSAVYVDANFKEGQLTRVRIGQPVTLISDIYGKSVVYHGKVSGLGGGTGAAFALIPAQNATGNWIKVVQRLPVRIKLDPKELAAHPLRVGLSMTARIQLEN